MKSKIKRRIFLRAVGLGILASQVIPLYSSKNEGSASKLQTKVTTIGMFTPHVFFPVKYQGKIKKVSERIYLAKDVGGKVIIDRPLTFDDRKVINWNTGFDAYFNNDGLVTRCDILDDQNHILQKYINKINNGRVDQFEIFEKDSLRKSLNFIYDSQGYIDKIKSFSYPDGSFLGTEDFTCDENGNITFIEFFSASGQREMEFYMNLDKDGRRTAYTQFDKNGDKISGANVVFGEAGFIEKKTEFNNLEERDVWCFEYEYDEKGNWTRCIVGNDKYSLIVARTYDYY